MAEVRVDEPNQEKEKAFSSINTKSFVLVVVLLTVILAISGALSYFIPQGSFQRDADGVIIDGTYVKGVVDLQIPTDKNGKAYRPKEVTSYENMDGYYSARTHVSLGLPLSFMKCNLNIKGGVSYNRIPSAIYVTPESGNVLQNMIDHKFQTNYANNIGYDAGVTIGSNISENLDFTVSWSGTYNQAWNDIEGVGISAKNNYFNHSANGSLKWVFLKRLTLTAAVSYVQYIGLTNKYNEDYVLCNLYLGCKVFKNKRGEVQVGVNDLLNQNTSFARTTGSGYTQNSWNSCIGRYFSVQFVYNLRHFGKKGSTKMSDYGYRESTGSVGVNRGTSSSWGYGPRR